MKFFKTTYQDDEDEVVSDLQYQIDFLRTFELEEFNDASISAQLDTFSKEIETNEAVMKWYNEIKNSNDNRFNGDCIYLMFSWDNLHKLAALMTSL
jgi:hypothetical protein